MAETPQTMVETSSMSTESEVNLEVLNTYLAAVAYTLLDFSKDEFYAELHKSETQKIIKNFATDENLKVLMICKISVESSAAGSMVEPEAEKIGSEAKTASAITKWFLEFSTDVSYKGVRAHGFAILKRDKFPRLELHGKSKPIATQLQIINTAYTGEESTPFVMAQTYIQNSFKPLMQSFENTYYPKASPDGEEAKKGSGSVGLRKVNQKLEDLSKALMQCQQDLEIPEVHLAIDPELQAIIKQAKNEHRSCTPNDFKDKLEDTAFINNLQNLVLQWTSDICKVLSLSRDISSGTAIEEVNFWLRLEKVLEDIQTQTSQTEVQETLKLLRSKKMNLSVRKFEYDARTEEKLAQVRLYNTYLRGIPINDLFVAENIDQITQAVDSILKGILKNTKNNTAYPLLRLIQLIEAVSRDLSSQLVKALSAAKILSIDFKEFQSLLNDKCEVAIFKMWEENMKSIKEMIKGIQKATSIRILNPNFIFEHVLLRNRITSLVTFRSQHSKLKDVIVKVLDKSAQGGRGSEEAATRALTDAYKAFQEFDALNYKDIDSYDAAKKAYDSKIEKIETEIIKQLKELLTSANNSIEMFKVFNKFNALFIRPRIKSAIQEYQTRLLNTVESDIDKLKNKFLTGNVSQNLIMRLKDIPSFSGKVIWAKQIEVKLSMYLSRVQDVLGPTWETYPEGKKIKESGEQFKRHLDMKPAVEAWQKQTTALNSTGSDLALSNPVFEIVQKRDKFELVVNFDEKAMTIYKEAKILLQYGYKLGYQNTKKAGTAKSVYPKAVAFQEILKTFYQTNRILDDKTAKLIASKRMDMQNCLISSLKATWSVTTELDNRIKDLSEKVGFYERAVMEIKTNLETAQTSCQELSTCPFSDKEFKTHLKQIQNVIDNFSFKEYANIEYIALDIENRITNIFIKRLSEIIPRWINEFLKYSEEPSHTLIQDPTIHAVKMLKRTTFVGQMSDQAIVLEPPMADARAYWLHEFHKLLEMICGLSRIETTAFIKQLNVDAAEDRSYRFILNKLPNEVLMKAYLQLEATFCDADKFSKSWTKYQALWDLDSTKIYEKLGDDIDKWQQLLTEIKEERGNLEESVTERSFGAIIIDYSAVQSKVSNKYDTWHKEILKKFADTMGDNMKSFHTTISGARAQLEGKDFDVNASDVTQYIMEIQDIKKKMGDWGIQMERFKSGQKLLDKHRFTFPPNWLYVDHVEGEWSALKQIFTKKSKAMDDQIPVLQGKMLAEEKSIMQKIHEIEEEWKQKRPDRGDLLPSDAINTLSILEQKLSREKVAYTTVCKAKELLGMEPGDMEKILVLEDDMSSLKSVWTELNKIWSIIDEVRNLNLSTVSTKTIKEKLDQALTAMEECPSKFRQYESFEFMKNKITKYKKMHNSIIEVKSEAMKPKHWKMLLTKLNIKIPQSDLTVWNLWEADLVKHDQIVKDIMTQARGELVLENFLRNIKDYWGSFDLDLVLYQGKCKLIRGWEELFAKIDEHINNLASMKISPYYKAFEEEIAPWDVKIQNLRIIFDIWIDVQKKWVHLQGIFFGSAEIKNQLQNEYTKFKNIDSEFTGLMKKVGQKPNILEVGAIPNLTKTLEKLAEQLSKVQKALGEYLAAQRGKFARFYFIGDEDLLEIIGNSKDVTNAQRHFPKMFAGITVLKSESNGDLLVGMSSREGEYVNFSNNVKISDDPAINVWLTKVENQMQISLANSLDKAVNEIGTIDRETQTPIFLEWIEKFPAQIVVLSMQVVWSLLVEQAIDQKGGKTLVDVEKLIANTLVILAEKVLTNLKKDIRKKYEQLITDFVHQRDVTRQLIACNITQKIDFSWLYHMRFYWLPKEANPLKKLEIKMAQGHFFYGFEYLGVGEKLVQTPLTDRCYLTLTQAMHYRLGGSPFGPAGTGKTESVKALGCQMGRLVLVFNCDEKFDDKAMGNIFIGICQVGAWGCFDEFNRLEERMLSSVSQQILTIQMGLREQAATIELQGKTVKINPTMGIFVTMNPDYAGRSNLPDNLKQLFRQFAMVKPDKDLIAQVMLYSQGFKSAERLSGKIVSLFDLCANQLSAQPHYDFGLRALKSVLVSAGNLKRAEKFEGTDMSAIAEWEQSVLLKSVCDTVVPKLVSDDIPLLSSLLSGVFPGSDIMQLQDSKLREAIETMCMKYNLLPKEKFIDKIMQLNQILRLHHGVMMVGPSGSGKTAAWKLLLDCLAKVDGMKGESYIIDPKAMTKEELYGKLDSTTLEWTDGIFTYTLRNILGNARGESNKRHWIIFDGDVDPEWAENLNSVLDDNKLLTLPSGDRLGIPPNVRIMFEVESLKYATLATVSRCGMVWFSDDIVTMDMVFNHYLARLKQDDYDSLGKDPNEKEKSKESKVAESPSAIVRRECVDAIRRLFDGNDSFVAKALSYAENLTHVMEFTKIRVLEAMFALIRKGINDVIEYNEAHPESNFTQEQKEAFMTKWVIHAVMWGIGGSMSLRNRWEYGKKLAEMTDVAMPDQSVAPLVDYEVSIEQQQWSLWKKKVPQVDIETNKVTDAEVVITTVDTLRHQEVLCSWLSEHRPFLLCGPPGSGKTMTLMATLKSLPDFEMIFVNFSSSTTPFLLLQTFKHYCEQKKTPSGPVLRPRNQNKWLVIFCDEINLPDSDKYGTQAVITFLRQLTEQKGFWNPTDKLWIRLEKIQFVGACNPPTDAGRHPLSNRFLRHAPLILVDFPGPESLKQIYGTFNRAMMKRVPALKGFADPLTDAMVDFYSESQTHFTADMQPHYIYSPRELTRWKYAINEALGAIEAPEDLVRLYIHEGLRLFQDRLVYQDEKDWTDNKINEVAMKHFPQVDPKALERPILFTNYISKTYKSVTREELRKYIIARLKIFYEEEMNVPIVVFDSVLDHILRIDRVLRQPIGHMLLVGASGVGKTTLSRFVSWINGLSVYQIKAGRNYSVLDFDENLRQVMRRAGVKSEKICFIFDESNVLSTAFLERMNALLASGDVPGLFDGDEYTSLVNQCREEYSKGKEGNLIDTEEELYKKFISNVQRNLHVVFTMNPSNPDFSNRTASSPALFNRCVIDWFGDWTEEGLLQVAKEFTRTMELPLLSFDEKLRRDWGKGDEIEDVKRDILVGSIVKIHNSVKDVNTKLMKSAKRYNFITPRDFLDFIKHFVELHGKKKEELEEQQMHLNVGLEKLKETEEEVKKLQASLDTYQKQLGVKQKMANEKLQDILKEQEIAENSKKSSVKKKEAIKVKQEEIKIQSGDAEAKLANVEPQLHEAESAVSKINPKDLNELKKLLKPPPKVMMTLQGVIMMLEQSTKMRDWKGPESVQAYLVHNDITAEVIKFKKEDITAPVKKAINEQIISKDFDYESVNFSSKAAGPLAKWLTSIISYSEIFLSITPLREKVANLRAEEESLIKENTELEELIVKLENSIIQLKSDYAVLIVQTDDIKKEMNKVLEKVTRSQQLIRNLSSERKRWEEASRSFKEQISSLIGDSLIAGAFLTYIGFFDHFYRQSLEESWKEFLEISGIKYKPETSLIEFLSKPSDRFSWHSHALPSDDLCIENAIVLSRFNRYPLVIDPSGQALEFIAKHYEDKKLIKTSFADQHFMKHLESSLRFGCPLLVQDVEKIEPILNSVLNKELHLTGGRILIRVGDQEIDFSENFKMFMLTRDSQAVFTPDLCSRVTFVNFTVTPSSLQEQCLNIYLKSEREEIDKKKSDLLKIQGEFKVKLRELEDSLLNALNQVKGNILENDEVLKNLENLKKQAADVQKEIDRSDEVMKEIQIVSNQYLPLALATSRIFFAMESLSSIYFLYQYSLYAFMETVFAVLRKNPIVAEIPKTNYEKRLNAIFEELFITVYHKFGQGLLNKHKLLFGLKLVQIRLQRRCEDEIKLLLASSIAFKITKLPMNFMEGHLTSDQLKKIEELDNNPMFKGLIDDLTSNKDKWMNFMTETYAEQIVPEAWNKSIMPKESSDLPVSNAIKKLIILKIFRPDRFSHGASELVDLVLTPNFLKIPEVDMAKIVEKESNSKSPLLLCCAPGYDASVKVDNLAKALNKKCFSVAIGSTEGLASVDKKIQDATQNGMWVLVKNVHLAPGWLVQLEKDLHKYTPKDSFRLFLTMEINPKVPRTLVRLSQVFVFEPPAGIKASLQRTYSTVLNVARSDKAPVERSRLHFLLSWFHAVVQERLRYTPIGWSKAYEFNESDQRCSLDTVDEWLDDSSKGLPNIDPAKIPWDAVKSLISQSLYGGKIDNEFDGKILSSLADQLFRAETFNPDFELFKVSATDTTTTVLKLPDARKTAGFLDWIEKLPNVESPLWSGLPVNVEKLLKAKYTEELLANLKALQGTDDTISSTGKAGPKVTDEKASWLSELQVKCEKFLEILPGHLEGMKRTATAISNPLFRFLEREVTVASHLLDTVRVDLGKLKEMCAGNIKSTNELREIAKALHQDVIPKKWKIYAIGNISAGEWMMDFKMRLDQFYKLTLASDYGRKGIWLGGLLMPEAYLTATRQAVAQEHKWSLEELDLHLMIGVDAIENDQCFILSSLYIEGAQWSKEQQKIVIGDNNAYPLPMIMIKWVHKSQVDKSGKEMIQVPVYLNNSRNKLLFSVKLASGDQPPYVWYQRGISLISWNKA